MRFSLLPLALLAARVAADGAAIVTAISQISNTTTSLNTTIAAWNGGLLGSIPIIVLSTTLLIDINDGTSTASASANLTTLEAIAVAQATLKLVKVVQAVLTTTIAAKPKFDKLLLSPLILLNLALEKDASDSFSAAVVSKVPAGLVALANTIVAPIDVAFDAAIAVYNPF